MGILLGAIADDFTGATDLANTLVGQGMNTVQVIGVPEVGLDLGDAEAVVVALKSRTIPAEEAISQSLDALRWLQFQGAQQFFFKYCSTFDSTDDGNIGPVADALLDALRAKFTIACPAFPANGRAIFQGHLFVGDELLSESGMKDHPLTPMTDSNLVQVLTRQTKHPVGLVGHGDVSKGAPAIGQAFDKLQSKSVRHAIIDAITDADLFAIGEAIAPLKLITGGSGIALGIPENFRKQGLLGSHQIPIPPTPTGRQAIISGSCSQATRAQVAFAKEQCPSIEVNPVAIADGQDITGKVLDWVRQQPDDAPVLIYSSADPEVVGAIQARYGREEAGGMVENTLGKIAQGLVEQGVRQMIVAGGETSGAVVQALQVTALRIGPEIDPGVPWTETMSDIQIALALKSGNFGTEDFFTKAFGILP